MYSLGYIVGVLAHLAFFYLVFELAFIVEVSYLLFLLILLQILLSIFVGGFEIVKGHQGLFGGDALGA